MQELEGENREMKTLEKILESSKIWDYAPFPMNSAFAKLPDCGTCSVIWGDNEEGYEHVSVTPKKKFNVPTWNDMCVLKDMFFEDDEEVYQIHPKKSEYVNVVENCLHLWKPIGHELNELVEMKTEEKSRWIPVTERLPEDESYILVSFENCTSPDIAWYKEDEEGGAFYPGDDECTYIQYGLFVNAWMPLPEQYKED